MFVLFRKNKIGAAMLKHRNGNTWLCTLTMKTYNLRQNVSFSLVPSASSQSNRCRLKKKIEAPRGPSEGV